MSAELTDVIIAKLKKSSFSNMKDGEDSNIILFSDTDVFPEPPYVVVKPEFGVGANTRQFRIIAHHKKGFFEVLDKYVLKELDELLLGGIEDDKGNRYNLYANGYTDIMPEPTDNTYFMERLYFTPLRSD